METVAICFIVGISVLGTLATVASVGKPRKPITGGIAATTVVTQALFVLAALYLWSH